MTDRAARRADASPAARRASPASDEVRDAFRELHGRRLHGFALLLALGDRPQAASLTADALAAGCERVDELRHPERAATWLRRRVLERVDHRRPDDARPDLDDVGAEPAVVGALAALRLEERAALIAATIERLDHRDVGTIVGRDGAALERLVRRARTRFVDAFAARTPEAPDGGPIVRHIHELARSALG